MLAETRTGRIDVVTTWGTGKTMATEIKLIYGCLSGLSAYFQLASWVSRHAFSRRAEPVVQGETERPSGLQSAGGLPRVFEHVRHPVSCVPQRRSSGVTRNANR